MHDKIPIQVYDVLEELHKWGHQAYVVGGCVRDTLLGRQPKDWDVCTDALPEKLLKIFPKCIPTGIKHGTVTVVSDKMHVEVTTFRSEKNYTDGRHPDQVEFEDDIELDLSRRDFTINAMAYSPYVDKLVDPFGGRDDLETHTVRAVGDPIKRFGEDGLRTMRVIRFCSQLGFQMDMNTFLAIEGAIPVFRKVSIERVRDEFEKILLSPHAQRGMYQLVESKLGQEFLPASGWWETMPVWDAAKDLDSRLCVLLSREQPGEAEQFLWKMKFTTKTSVSVMKSVTFFYENMHGYRDLMSNLPDQRRAMAKLGKEHVARTVNAGAAALIIPEKLRVDMVTQLAFNPPLSTKDLALKGGDVLGILAVKPGPEVGHAIGHLMNFVLEWPENNTKEKLEDYLRTSYAVTMGLPLVEPKL